ncbi:uncharacterized protein LACBIDRAFT_328287 [Laccaria bicolor S238N-H82]|uniref:Predicted protein n=1 Tax=Laccaria bicolor (strain S238N-H82 / ATCC MYA-4686) TaxID=486041 RepID=B0DEE9_LACBS|nr:uncharacterized protein LACBIDRAFT_328287 [Laccaria bicolor S238N-H82]EDR06921.1 predicted protein [Laccaria bicolor S238N-H82]|eukprot:XP_001882294.1 predicted protein [Laccaria bicolor S238N-H82]
MGHGRPVKKKRNISGLWNQAPHTAELLESISEVAEQVDQSVEDVDSGYANDRNHLDVKDNASSEKEDDMNSDFESDDEWKGLMSEVLGKKLAALSCEINGDQKDLDWIPYKLRPKKDNDGSVSRHVSIGPSIPESESTERGAAEDDSGNDSEQEDDDMEPTPEKLWPEEMEAWQEELEEDVTVHSTDIKTSDH